MFLWCWLWTGLSDQGRITDDLKSRGVLSQIQQGDIPRCLRALPICEKCLIPYPARGYHCDICGSCVLRSDHHCGVVGACIGGKNFKGFVLSFFFTPLFTALLTGF
jgi:palmitoyltransferase